MNKKCERCSTNTRSIYHLHGECPADRNSEIYIWIKDREKPIEKADRFLRQYCGERQGAKGWV